MADAEVIPLGTRGRPGRGGNRSRTPSSAARSLAGTRSASRAKRQAPTTPREEASEAPATPRAKPAAKKTARKGTGTRKSTSTGASPRTSKARTRPRPTPVSTDETPPAAAPEPTPITPPAEEVFVQGRGGRVGFDLAAAIGNAAREVFGESWESGLAEFLAFLRRRVTGDYVVDEYGFDPDLTSRLSMASVRPLVEKWFRVDVQGIENIPTDGGALLVGNHSGTVPIDGLVTGLIVHDHADRYLRMLGADLVFRMPFIGEMARKGGATLACNEDAERLLGQGELVGVWPEGFKGVGKPFGERYTLQRFGRGGFVSAALRTRVPIVPCSIVGAEEIYPLVGNMPTLARLLGVPYIPITPFFPWFGPLGMIPLPSKWLIEFGEPIRTDALTDEQVEDPMIVFNLTDQVRETIQQTLYALLMQRRNVFF
ncbi:MAG TPA: 1-acyl-sn-glycerol-3-phosphate acyltransferase [Nocardioidaceae bacterium]|nr:1-acyl-sn-glycerol-3-phosphate acyltransferase [Nocardioidaceae bacterium]